MKKTIRKIEILFMALICIFAMSGMPMQVYAGPADNSLETLTVAEGSLSPAFEGSRMYYTVQVGQDVSSVKCKNGKSGSNDSVRGGNHYLKNRWRYKD